MSDLIEQVRQPDMKLIEEYAAERAPVEKQGCVLYFSTDPHMNRTLCARTQAMINQIREIDAETTTGEAFRKYVRQFLADLEKRISTGSAEYL